MSTGAEKWQAWQTKFNALPHLTPAEKQRATEIPLRVLRIREARATS
ncbi:hypothetical protein [Caballeronia mineralivorans]|nr:hypothetical protein [Caballeronia mineralivorans]